VLVDHLDKSFGGVRALTDISFEVGAGEIVGLLGANGAGKTTTVNVLATLLRPDAGQVFVAGHNVVTDPAAVRAAIAMTGQFSAVDSELTGYENLVFFASLVGLGRRQAKKRASELLERFSLTSAARQRVETYSGGMRRRLSLATSLVVEPRVLFLDEPTTGLDPRGRRALWDLVRELRDRGVAILLTTQYLEEADQLANRIVFIDHGQVVADGTAEELKALVGGSICEVVPKSRSQTGVALAALEGLPVASNDTGDTIAVFGEHAVLIEVARRLDAAGIAIGEISLRRPSLDEVFLTLTGGGTVSAPEFQRDEARP
jgi:ABC-2 type transport system ATP-binding protein